MIKGIVARLEGTLDEGMKLMREIVRLLERMEKLLENLEKEEWKSWPPPDAPKEGRCRK
jgi:hypothetical protein